MSHPTPLLCSVIIPVYNGRNCIANCLTALAAGTLSPAQFEVIVVDDGSTDGTDDAVRGWLAAEQLGHWRLLRQENAGPAAARNAGAIAAISPLLLFTDADCVPASDWVQAMIEPFQGANPPAAVMGRYSSRQTEAAARFAQAEFEERYRLMAGRERIDLIATYAAAYQRTLFLEMGGFDTGFPQANNEDVDFSYRLSHRGAQMLFAPAAVVAHTHSTTWGHYARVKAARAYWRMQVYRRYPGKAVSDSYTPQSLKVQLVFGVASVVAVPLALFTRVWGWLFLPLFFLLSALPTAAAMARQEPGFLLWALWGLWLRSLAFAVGVAWGILKPFRFSAGDGQRQPVALPLVNE